MKSFVIDALTELIFLFKRHAALGFTLQLQGKFEQAIESYTRALALQAPFPFFSILLYSFICFLSKFIIILDFDGQQWSFQPDEPVATSMMDKALNDLQLLSFVPDISV